MGNRPIVVIGSINMDLVIKSTFIPKPGETVIGEYFYRACGGKGANQAVTISKLGGNCYFVGKIGSDSFGAELKENLIKNKVKIDYLMEDDLEPSGIAFITVDKNGENSIVVAPGANMKLKREDIERALPIISQAGTLLIQLEIPIETVEFSLNLAKKYGLTTILNPAPVRQKIDREIISLADIITPNRSELEKITETELKDDEDIIKAGRKVLEYGVKWVIVTLGSRGVIGIGKDREIFMPAIKVSPIDTTGAGDVFNGALTLKLSQGESLEKAMRFAVVCAGISVTRKGAQSSIPTLEEANNFIKKEGIEV
ncbi:MAG: ribokinase [bacterium]|nr:ribokinase [bacterium]